MSETLAPQEAPATKPRRRRRIFPIAAGLTLLCIVLLVLFWNWDWFIPFVEARASAAAGRRVTIAHLHVKLGRITTVALDDVVVTNPDGFPEAKPLAHIGTLTIEDDVMAYIRQHGAIVLPRIAIDRPDINALALSDGRSNFAFKFPAADLNAKPSPPPQIDDLQITDGTAHVVDPKVKANFELTIATREATEKLRSAIMVDAHGTYAAQPITGNFIGGAVLSLQDVKHPYPIDLHIANGPTKVSLVGTVENPLKFAGARLELKFSGPDMAALYPLTGIPIPQTPPYSIAGNLDYAASKIRFTDFEGRVGSSDLEGDVLVDPHTGGVPDVTMNLASRRIDLTDLGGFIGTPAGKASTAGQTTAQKQTLAKVEASKTLLPTTPINLPKIRAANIHLKYRGEHIENEYTPFDKLVVALDIVDGKIDLHPLDFVVGNGDIASTIALAPEKGDVVHADARVKFRHIDLSRLMQATHTFKGQGIIGGEAVLNTNGNSLSSMMAQGNGELKLVLVSAGDVSALLVDITGLEFGNALLSALGVPNRAKLECFVTDLPMKQGVVDVKSLLMDTDEGRVVGRGSVDFRDETLDFSLTTRSKHFSVGSLPGPINVTGKIASPSIRPGAEIVARAGAAAGLGILLTPLGALLPTIQFGVGNDNACTVAEAQEREPIKVAAPTRRKHK